MRKFRGILFSVAVVGLTLAPASSLAAAPPDRLSPAAVAAIRATMEPAEIAAAKQHDGHTVPVAYARFRYRVSVAPDGTETPALIEREDASAATGFDLLTTAGPAAIAPMSSGTTTYYDLYMSISVNRDTRYSGYTWLLGGYFSYSKNNATSLDWCNSTEDKLATGWAGGTLVMIADGYSGTYYGSPIYPAGPLDIHRDGGIVPNAAVSYAFHEWNQNQCTYHPFSAQWGQTWQDIQETTYANQMVNVELSYFHDGGSQLSPGVSVSVSGPSISISASPSSAIVWSAGAYTYFTH